MSAMKLMSARSRRAPRPPSRMKRLRASFTARSKSMMPSSGPRSQCGFILSMPSAAKSRGVPQRRTSGCRPRSRPRAVVSAGMLGVRRSSARSSASASSRSVPMAAISSLMARTRSLGGFGLGFLAGGHHLADGLRRGVALGLQRLLLRDGGAGAPRQAGEARRVPRSVAVLHRLGDGFLVVADEFDVEHGRAPSPVGFVDQPSIAHPGRNGRQLHAVSLGASWGSPRSPRLRASSLPSRTCARPSRELTFPPIENRLRYPADGKPSPA